MKYRILLAIVVTMLMIANFFVGVTVNADFSNTSTPDYTGWSIDIRITSDPGISYTPKIALDSENNSHIVWADNRSGNFEIFYEKKSSIGQTLVDDKQLTYHSSDTDYLSPKVVIDSNSFLHVMWFVDSPTICYGLHYMKLDTDGNILTEEAPLDVDIVHYCAYDFVVEPGETPSTVLHIVFTGPEGEEPLSPPMSPKVWPMPTDVWYTKILDNGEILVDPIPITYYSSSSGPYYINPRIAIDSQNNLHVAMGWFLGDMDTPTFAFSFIHYMKLDSNGNILVQDTRLTPDFSGGNWYSGIVRPYPRISLDSEDNVFIVWEDKRNQFGVELYYTKLDNGGSTLIDDTPITNINLESWGNHMHPDIDIDSNNKLHIVWSDYRNEDDDYEIYYTCLNNDGQIFTNITRLTNCGGISSMSSVAATHVEIVKILWHDNRDSNYEIYYKQRLLSAICGDCNGDGIVDLGDIVYLISYLFRGGPPPQPLLCIGDCNHDGTVDLGDIVFLINYLFKGGPEPERCCG